MTNVGEGVAPTFRYMVHAVYGQVPPLSAGRAFWFLPTAQGIEFFDESRGNREMGVSSGGAPVNHAFSRFTPGHKADKPRYEAGGWGAVLTSAGPTYIYYDPAKFDFMQYWFGGDSEWHFTFEPHTKPVDLKPGESMRCEFTLAFDSRDVPFNTPTISFEQPQVVAIASPGGVIAIRSRATTVSAERGSHAKLAVDVKNPAGKSILSQALEADVKPFVFSDLAAEVKLPTDAPLGNYAWTVTTEDGKTLASGKTEVLTTTDLDKRKMEAATAEIKAKYEQRIRDLETEVNESRKVAGRWNDGVNLALSRDDDSVWPSTPGNRQVSVGIQHRAVPVQGNWKANESVRFKEIKPAPGGTWPDDGDKILEKLGADRSLVRDVALAPDGHSLAALVVSSSKNRSELVRIELSNSSTPGAVQHLGQFSDKPGETDGNLGSGARAVVIDGQGNLWVSTNAWGQTSIYGLSQDGSPFEESVIGVKGAVKKFSPDGNLLGTVSLLSAPSDLQLALADGKPVILASYRHVSAYYGAQVKEGVMLIDVATIKRVAEIKIPGGSACVDSAGRLWDADVAGHIACYDLTGHKQFDVPGSPKPAVLDAKLPADSPVPVVLRGGSENSVWSLATLRRKIAKVTAEGVAAETEIPASAGALWKLGVSGASPVAIGDKSLWTAPK